MLVLYRVSPKISLLLNLIVELPVNHRWVAGSAELVWHSVPSLSEPGRFYPSSLPRDRLHIRSINSSCANADPPALDTLHRLIAPR